MAAPKTPDIAAHADPAISIPGTSAKLRAGRIDQPAQRPSEVVDRRVARKACNDAALRPDQRHDRVVGEGIFVRCRAGHLLTEDRWRIYSDNIAMARWLQSQLPVLLALSATSVAPKGTVAVTPRKLPGGCIPAHQPDGRWWVRQHAAVLGHRVQDERSRRSETKRH